MGLGRFGVAGCCKCSPDTPTVGETAGPCGWCGYYDPAEFDLQYPIPEDKLCQRRLEDSFSTSKDYPRVPWWSFQQLFAPGTWQEIWARGDYQHLNDGHYCYTAKEPLRYAPVSGAPWRTHLVGLLWDTGGAVERLQNLPPFYGSYFPFTYSYPKRYENGLIINSPTDKTDLIPLKQYMSLEFNTPKRQWPQQVSWVVAGNPFPCLFEPCFRTWTLPVATQWSELLPYPYGPTAFGWNAPGQPPGLGSGRYSYGLAVTAFRVDSSAVLALDTQLFGNQLHNLKEYLPKTQKLTMGYYVGSDGAYVGREAEGWKEVEIPYQENFSLKLEVQFDDYPEDNRKCWLTVKFLMNDNVYFTQQHLIAKPGWRQTGAATDAQAFIQSFCPSQISARNEISGVNISHGSTAGWYYEALALWSPKQTPRESFWMDSWQARFDRL
jgi:hypothetical protein